MITMEDAEPLLHQVAASAKTTRSHLRCCAVSVKRWTSERSSPGKKKTTTTSTRTFNRKTTTTKRKTPSARNSLEITMSRVAAQYSCMALISMLWLSAALTGTHCQASHEVQTGRFARAEQRQQQQQQKHYLNSVVGVFPAQQQQQQQRMIEKRSASALLMPINELRVASGSKNEPPSRPTVDWSRQRPYFGSDMARNVSVELGKTAYLSCKVFELGDKTVSWLRPRENEILTAGRYTYIGDPRFASINDNGSHDWILEIKDVALNDSTSYECQVSTDPKMSAIINLHVKAAKARIKQGEQFYAPLGSNIEFTCEVGQKQTTTGTSSSSSSSSTSSSSQSVSLSATPSSHVSVQQTYWYFNGNLLNYARTFALDKNFSIDWDPMTQTSRFKLFNVQLSDAGNYTCKPTSSEPTNIRLHVKRYNKNGARDRAVQQHNVGTKEAQRNRQQYGLEPMESGAASGGLIVLNHWLTFVWPLLTTLMLILHH